MIPSQVYSIAVPGILNPSGRAPPPPLVDPVSNATKRRKNKLGKSVEAFPLLQTLAQAIDHRLTENSTKDWKALPQPNRSSGEVLFKLFSA